MPRRRTSVLLIHGGAGSQARPADREDRRRRLRRILEASYAYLQKHSALEAVVEAVRRLEDDPAFNAGTGSLLQADGVARLSASVMDGPSRVFAAALNVEQVRNPVLIARALLDQSEHVLAGEGARRFARSIGLKRWNPVTPARRKQWQARQRGRHGTVGAVARDAQGRLAAATSTGGRGFERPGRVSDSGTPAGNYAIPDAAVSCTGDGEHILDEGLAVRIAQRVADGAPLAEAAGRTLAELRQRRRELGWICLDARGGWQALTTLPILYAVGRAGRRRLEAF
jgi:L-asparaginase